MNTPSPLVPQGTILEQRNQGRARVKIAVFVVLAIHGVGLLALLMQGCNKKEPDAGAGSEQTNASSLAQSFAEPTNTPAASNAASLQTNINAPAEALSSTSPPAVPASVPAAVPTEYKIQRGDTFATISKKFHVTVKGIETANQGVDPNKLQIGQTIHIPAPTVAATTTPSSGSTGTAATADAPAGAQSYTVKSGDTLIAIATNFHVSVRALRAANSLTTDKIKVGQKLTIPAKTSTTLPTTGALTSAAPNSATLPPGQ